MSRKKVLIVSDYVKWTFWGIETYIQNLKKVLPENEFEIKYFGGENIVWWKKYFYLLFSNFNFIYANKFEKILNEYNPDIVWFHSISRLLWPKVIEKMKNFDWISIVTYHDFWYFSLFASNIYEENQIAERFNFMEFLKKAWYKWYLLLPYSIWKYFKLKKLKENLYKYVKIHTVPSKFMKKYPIKLWYSKNVELLPNFILKENLIERKNIYQDKINFIFFWRLTKEKWVALIISFLSKLWELKYSNNEEYRQIVWKIRFFIFWDGEKEKELLETFTWTDLTWKDIGIIQNLKDKENILDFIDKNPNKFVYYFWRRDFSTIKKFLSFSHYNLVPSLFLETFWLSALEWAANWLINIWLDKENIKNFILEDFRIQSPINENFSKKLFSIIKKHNLENWNKLSQESKKLAEKFII